MLTETISGSELVWRTESDGEVLPQIFESEKAAQLEILDDLQSDIEQFCSGEREWEEIHWPGDEYVIAEIEISENGKLVVWQTDYEYDKIIETSIELWRKSL